MTPLMPKVEYVELTVPQYNAYPSGHRKTLRDGTRLIYVANKKQWMPVRFVPHARG